MISLIIPSANRSLDHQITLKTILNQSYQDFEVLTIFNGPDTIVEITNQEDTRVRRFRSKLNGVTYARAIGNLFAEGDIIVQLDDDVSFIDTDCLKKIFAIFKTTDADVVGAMELHRQADVDSFLVKQPAYNEEDIINQFENPNIGQLDNNYNLTTGFEKLLNQPQGIYPIESFRSCFMAYRKSVLSRVKNWDSNYCLVGSRMGVREETDFLLRCRNAGFKIYYTNITAIWHRIGDRNKALIARDKGLKRHFYYAAAHSYMAMKDILETSQYLKIAPWFIFQLLWGGYKNPGFLLTGKINRSIAAAVYNLVGFFWGVLFALFRSRRFMSDPDKYILRS